MADGKGHRYAWYVKSYVKPIRADQAGFEKIVSNPKFVDVCLNMQRMFQRVWNISPSSNGMGRGRSASSEAATFMSLTTDGIVAAVEQLGYTWWRPMEMRGVGGRRSVGRDIRRCATSVAMANVAVRQRIDGPIWTSGKIRPAMIRGHFNKSVTFTTRPLALRRCNSLLRTVHRT